MLKIYISLPGIKMDWPLFDRRYFLVFNRMGVSGPALKPFGFSNL